ncbi:hypothetical protein [Actinoallomurus vinaceus]|uniref:hypothetical protein n=1 Tax=Actinoallomurus vinaceus TaxID=1080074 RepID=UPI0031ED896E
MNERVTRGLRVLVLLLGALGFALPAGAGTASAYATSAETLSAVSASAYAPAATVSSAAALATKKSTLRTWAAAGASASSSSQAVAVVPGRTATGASWRRLGTVAELPAAPRQVSALTPRGRGPPSITGS